MRLITIIQDEASNRNFIPNLQRITSLSDTIAKHRVADELEKSNKITIKRKISQEGGRSNKWYAGSN